MHLENELWFYLFIFFIFFINLNVFRHFWDNFVKKIHFNFFHKIFSNFILKYFQPSFGRGVRLSQPTTSPKSHGLPPSARPTFAGDRLGHGVVIDFTGKPSTSEADGAKGKCLAQSGVRLCGRCWWRACFCEWNFIIIFK